MAGQIKKSNMKRKQLGKKGIFLTFIAISIIAAFVIMFTPSSIELRKDIVAVKIRVSTLNEHVADLEKVYLERALEATGTKAIISLINYMESQNAFLLDFEAAFEEVLLYGTIGGTPIMADNTYAVWASKIKNVSEFTFNVDTKIEVNDIEIYQIRPWFLTVDANISLTLTSETASWDKNMMVRTEIDIQKFDDPYYLINTGGTYRNRINKSDVKFNEWTLEKVKEHIQYGTYTHFQNSNSPSFIMRFTNTSFNSSCCGIESIVNPNDPSVGDGFGSYADYLFFNHTYQNKCNELYNVTSLWLEFKPVQMEFEHLALYNLTDLSVVRTC